MKCLLRIAHDKMGESWSWVKDSRIVYDASGLTKWSLRSAVVTKRIGNSPRSSSRSTVSTLT